MRTLSKCLAVALAAVLPAAWAAPAQVQVLDGAGQPLAGAVVFLESAAAKAAARPVAGAEIEQLARQFTQRVTVVTAGSEVAFPNRDKVRHHVFSFSPPKPFEIKLYAGTPANPVLFDRPGVVVLGCNIHDGMVAWVLVVETPHYGQTDVQGRLKLADVPAGAYRLRTWHPDLPPGAPPLDQALAVAADGATATVRLPLQVAQGR